MKTTLSIALLSALLAGATPAFALPAAPAPAVAAQGQASGVVLDSANRILGALDSRRAEFKGNPAALKQFIKSEFNRSFDSDYAARLVLGVHGRGAPAAARSFCSSHPTTWRRCSGTSGPSPPWGTTRPHARRCWS